MYQVYVENAQALLEMKDTDPDRYNRKMAEFNLDDEYLQRLKEVIKMRSELEAELAKILGDDPGRQLKEDLWRFKQLMETGHVPTTEGQSCGHAQAGKADNGKEQADK